MSKRGAGTWPSYPQRIRSTRQRNQQPTRKKIRIMSVRQLSGTNAVVTGASRGFGRAISVSLVERGAHVVGVARNAKLLAELKEQLGDAFTPPRSPTWLTRPWRRN
jgi:short chain dehydrogenase